MILGFSEVDVLARKCAAATEIAGPYAVRRCRHRAPHGEIAVCLSCNADSWCCADPAQPGPQWLPGDSTIVGGLACCAPVPLVAASWHDRGGLHSY